MKPNILQEKSTEELLKRKKVTQLATGMLAGMMIVLAVMAILLGNQRGFSKALPYFMMPLGLLPILIICFNDIKATKKELQARNAGQ